MAVFPGSCRGLGEVSHRTRTLAECPGDVHEVVLVRIAVMKSALRRGARGVPVRCRQRVPRVHARLMGRASDATGNERWASSIKAARVQSPTGSVAKWA